MLKNIKFMDEDTRARKYLAPEKILLTRGNVAKADRLESYRYRHIHGGARAVLTTTKDEKAGILFDFGTEIHGGVSIGIHTMTAPQAVFRLSFGESANEALSHLGEKGACNDHSPRDFEIPLPAYSLTEHGWTGFRFLYLELLTECEVHVKTVQAVAIYQPYEYIGSFECDDEKINRIYDTAAYTCHLCIQNELWDGIKRDRMIWVGDMSPEMKTIKYVFGDIPQIYSGLALTAQTATLPTWINYHPTYSLWWLVILDEWCFYTGNKSYLDEQKEYITGLTKQVLENVDENGFFGPSDFLDWPSKGFPSAKAGIKGLLKMCLEACIRMNDYFGNEELSEECRNMLGIVLKNREACGDLKQIAAFLLLNDLQKEDSVKCLQTGGAEGFSTFMSYYILTAMTRCCTAEETLTAMRDYYGAMLDLGATTFWEDFDMKWVKNACRIDEICPDGKSDVHGDNGKYCYLGYRHSLCHGWSSGPVPFLTEYVLGIDIVDEGCKTIRIKPNLGYLAYAKGSIATPFGKVSVSHAKNADGSIKTVVDAPHEITIICE